MPELPAVSNNLVALAAILIDPEVWGLPAENCTVIADPESADEVLDAIHDAAHSAEEALVVYFAGHGLLDESGDLRLGLPDSNKQRLHRAISFREIRREVVITAARCYGKVVILDCCYSGSAMSGFMADSVELADQAVVDGAYLMTATAEHMPARAPIGAQYTAFTGALVDALRDGVPGGPDLLDMDTLFAQVDRELRAHNHPIPQRRSRESGHRIAIARNRAATLLASQGFGGRQSAPAMDTGPYRDPAPPRAMEITDPHAQIEALQQVSGMVAGPNPSRQAIAEAEQLARRVTRRSPREAMFLSIVKAVASQDADDALRLANDITDGPRRREALHAIAQALATHDMRRAQEMLAQIARLDATEPAAARQDRQ
jgi:hypothetical protein